MALSILHAAGLRHALARWIPVLWVFGAYLLGSIATAIPVARIMGLPDPRQGGSGNPGATNILRLGGKKAALMTLAGDLLKGFLPVLAARLVGLDEWTVAAVGLATFLGHLYPIYFGFRGGKGVATALGILLGLDPMLGTMTLAIWLLVFALTRISSVAALTAALVTPAIAWIMLAGPVLPGFISTLALWIIWRHRNNLVRLLRGEEQGFGSRHPGRR